MTFVSPLSIHMFLPALPYVRQAFAVDQSAAQLPYGLAVLVMAFATLVYGSVSDRLGRLPVLLGGLALFTVGAVLAVTASTITVLLIGRVLQGAGAAREIAGRRGDAVGADAVDQIAIAAFPQTAPENENRPDEQEIV